MKLPLLLLLASSSLPALAQTENKVVPPTSEELKKRLEDWQKKYKIDPKTFRMQPGYPTDLLGTTVLRPPVKPGVYTLPLDRMPCVVPDMEGVPAIPNAAPHVSVPFKSKMPKVTPTWPVLPEGDAAEK